MRGTRSTRIGGALGICLMLITNLVQPVGAHALAGVSLPLLDDLLSASHAAPSLTQESRVATQSVVPSSAPASLVTPNIPSSSSGDNLKLATPVPTPIPSPNNLKVPIALSWSAVEGADHYTYQYGTDPNFEVATTTMETTTESVPPPAEADGTTYYWRVKAVPPTVSTSPLASDWSETSHFMVDTTPPVVTLPSPAGSIRDGARLAFTASDPNNGSGLATYGVTIADSKNTVVHQDEPVAFPDQNGSYGYTWPAGLPNGNYTLTLAATDNAGNRVSAVMASVELANALPSTTATISPNNQVATTSATLTIHGIASANTSIVRIMTTEGVKVIDVTPNTSGTWEYTFGDLKAGIYQFDVSAIDAGGNRSAVTLRVQTTVVAYVPPAVTIISPDITAPLDRPSAFTPLTTIVPVGLRSIPDAATTASIAAIAPDVSIDSTRNSSGLKDTSGQVLAASTSGWQFFGIGWQWWAIVGTVGGAGWWVLRTRHFQLTEADDL